MYRVHRNVLRAAICLVAVAIICVWAESASAAPSNGAQAQAQRILRATGVQGGLVAHVGCDDGKLTAALRAGESFVVHGLDTSQSRVRAAREHIRSLGLYGPVTVEHWSGGRLPYVDNLVRLAVVEDVSNVSREEIMRVLSPRGVAYIRRGGRWVKKVKPWPEEIDEWTHFLYGPDNNAVSKDERVGPPRYLQWVGTPRWCRSHDHLSSVSAVVSSGGRVFYIADEAPAATVAFESEWRLVARDAFSGVILWKKEIPSWAGRLRGFRSGPADLARRLVAVDDRVFVTLDYNAPVSVLQAATGEVLQTYEETAGAEEIIYDGGIAYVVVAPSGGDYEAEIAGRRGEEVPKFQKTVMAIRAETGDVLWRKKGGYVMPKTMAVADGRVFFENSQDVVCLDAGSGEEVWSASRKISQSRLGWSTPTLVVRSGVVYSADRNPNAQSGLPVDKPNAVDWVPSSKGGNAPPGQLIAFSAADGERLWSAPSKEIYNAPVDVLIARDLLWTGLLVRANEPGITKGRDPLTGEVEFTRPPDQEFFRVGMGHHRCYRNKATEDYLLLGRAGIEFIDTKTGEGVADHWVRGACQYGIMPANGLMYAPPHSCACFIKAKLRGFNALAASMSDSGAAVADRGPKLVRGPAYDLPVSMTTSSDDGAEWPTLRHDAARTGKAACSVPASLETAWECEPGGQLSAPVMADGRVFLASVDSCTVHALDARTGDELWHHTVGGKVDSPPTIYNGRAIFGSADGWVYCLRASDGELVWKFRAAPENRKVGSFNRVESAWPVHGSVMMLDGVAYFAVGRSSYLDGGMYLYGLDPETGKTVLQRRIDSRDPETGQEPKDEIRGLRMPGALPDVLSTDGKSIFMRHKRFSKKGEELSQDVAHMFSSVGFLDDSWWHRTYWFVGTSMGVAWGGWPKVGQRVPSGRILALDGSKLYGFGRNRYTVGGSHVGLGENHYELFASEGQQDRKNIRWRTRLPFWVRGMVLAGDRLFVAGPPVAKYLRRGAAEGEQVEAGTEKAMGPWYGKYDFRLRDPRRAVAAWRGKKGGELWAVSTSDGEKVSGYDLDSPPVFDGVIAAGGRLYVCTMDGRVVCMAEE